MILHRKPLLNGDGKRRMKVEVNVEDSDEDTADEPNVEIILCNDGPQHQQPNGNGSISINIVLII